jgi:hypothetical protein
MNVTENRLSWMRYRMREDWLGHAWDLGQSLRPVSDGSGQLFVVGTASYDPWHVTAHLDDEARLRGLQSLRPILLRFRPPAAAPPHLQHSIAELSDAGRGHTLLVTAPDAMNDEILQRLSDARRRGASLFAIATGDSHDLTSLAHDSVTTPDNPANGGPADDPDPFAIATHLVAVSAGTQDESADSLRNRGLFGRRRARSVA